jgi:hypothetical protein
LLVHLGISGRVGIDLGLGQGVTQDWQVA